MYQDGVAYDVFTTLQLPFVNYTLSTTTASVTTSARFYPQLLQSDPEHILSASLQSQDELRAVKSEVAALRLEMQAATQARLESEARRLEADKELATLHRELHKVGVWC